MLVPLQALDDAVGKSTPTQNLNKAFHAIFAFHQRVVPMLCGLFAEPELLAAYRESLTSRNKGPQGAIRSSQALHHSRAKTRPPPDQHGCRNRRDHPYGKFLPPSLPRSILRHAPTIERSLQTNHRFNLGRNETTLSRSKTPHERSPSLRLDNHLCNPHRNHHRLPRHQLHFIARSDHGHRPLQPH